MTHNWTSKTPGCIVLPSGRVVRGRSLRSGFPETLRPDFGLYLARREPTATEWGSRWIEWPDFWLPRDRSAANIALIDAWQRSENERVEVACGGGVGRTGTALACIAILDGVPAEDAVTFIRTRYNYRAVETPWQRRYVRNFSS